MNRSSQSGVALIMALILIVVLSVMGISLMFLSQSETWSSMNYRLMSQTRDVAEAGVNKTANFLLYSYNLPGTVIDPMAAYNLIATPVLYNGYPTTVSYGGSPVILSSTPGVSSNYPVGAVQTSFNSASQGSLTAGFTAINYTSNAVLLSMRQANVYGSVTPVTIQTWLITSAANINGIPNAQVEISAILEREITPTFNYAAFATNSGCGALQFGGGGTTDSYDSTTVSGGSVTTQNYGGNVGTNGNLSTNGNPTTINGSLSTPRSGVGSCSVNNVTAWTAGTGHVTGSIIELPQPVNYPTPAAPSPLPPTTSITLNNKASDCGGAAGCTYSGGAFTLAPGGCAPGGTPATFGNVTVKGDVHLSAGCYNINTLTENGQGRFIIDSGPVVVSIAALSSTGTPLSGTVVDLTGGSISNPSLNPMNFQILYAGTGTVNLKGGSAASALVYAPNCTYSFAGNGDWYGAVIGAALTDLGGAGIHYDRRLQNNAFVVGNYFLSSFTWKKY